jgi:manganese-dependent inorganic pyrophosphatase
MSHSEQPLRVIGHKNPDTDSICSAIAYAHFKREVMGVHAVPYRAGNLNPQTRFVLDYFKVQEPHLLTTMFPKLSDIMIQAKQVITLSEDDTLGTAQALITQQRFAFLPVTGEGGRYAGKISALRLAGLPQDLAELCCKPNGSIQFQTFLESVAGRLVCGDVPTLFQGRVWLQGLAKFPPAGEYPLLAVLPDSREAGVIEACELGSDVIVICATETLDEGIAQMLRGRKVCVVTTSCYALDVATKLCLSMPLRDFIERRHPSFKPDDLVREAQKEIRKSNEGGFMVIDDDGFICGIITRLSFLTDWRFRVALVDHNELSQAVDGVEEASVEEIIDHHRLGYRSTDQPITFINKVVGCTCTIIAELYRNSRQDPPLEIAGLMLSAILSDTVILQSPTTTALDREMASWLAGIAKVDLHAYGAKMFSAGCAVEGVDPRTLIQQDLKIYDESGWKLSVSQMETVGLAAFKSMRESLVTELDRAREGADCHFSCLMVTDITSSTSLLLCSGEEKIIHTITYPKVGENLFEMIGVLSRKKQMMPYLVDLLKGL